MIYEKTNMRPIDTLRSNVDFWKKATTDARLRSTLDEVLKLVDEAIYHMDHQEDESPWNRVEERFPEKDGEYATWSFRGYWIKNHWNNTLKQFHYRRGEITHWMPIEPPKEDEA